MMSLLRRFQSLRKLRHLPVQARRLMRRLRTVTVSRAQALLRGKHRFQICLLLLQLLLLLLLPEVVVDVVAKVASRLSLLGRALAFLFLTRPLGGKHLPLLCRVLLRG